MKAQKIKHLVVQTDVPSIWDNLIEHKESQEDI